MALSTIPVLVSADGEWRAVRALLQPQTLQPCPLGEAFQTEISGFPCLFIHSGWGKIATASATQYALDQFRPELIVNIGTCGGFEGFAELAEILIPNDVIVYDIYERMDDPLQAITHYRSSNAYTWITSPLPPNTRYARIASADQDVNFSSYQLLTHTYQVAAADWETGAFAWVASRAGTPWLGLRAVSDIITPHTSETDGKVELWRSRLQDLMSSLLSTLPFYFSEFASKTSRPN